MKKLLLGVLVLVSFCQIVYAQKNKKVLLALTSKVGDKYQVDMVLGQQISMQGMEMPQKMSFGTTYEVMKVEANGITSIKMTYTSVKFVQDNPAGKIEYDSESKEEPEGNSKMMAQAFGQILGKYVVFQMKVKLKKANKFLLFMPFNI